MKLPVHLLDRAEAEMSFKGDAIDTARARIASNDPHTLDGREKAERRLRMIAEVAAEDLADAYERYIGDNELLPINYLLLGYLQSRSVGLIRYFDRKEGKEAMATGFLISESLLLTNHHVFPVKDPAEFLNFAKDATVEFNFEYDIDGNRGESVRFALQPDRFLYTFQDLDMAIVAVSPNDRTNKYALKSQGYLVLNGNLGKVGLGDFASIIQHPSGKEKQIAIRKNEVIATDQQYSIQYVSDTAQGSSGAPVFNDQWQVIALHSAGVGKKNAQGQYVDRDNQVIESVNGRIDGDRIVWESNRGIRVSAMMQHLNSAVAAHPLIQPLFSAAYTDSRPYAFLSRPTVDAERTTLNVAPATALPATCPPVNIHISIGSGGQVSAVSSAGLPGPLTTTDAAFEKKFEDELDFSDCTGFDANFLGQYIPMPIPSPNLRKKLAFLVDNPSAYTLKYHHFSTLHHAVRRVPIVSAINVHGKHRYQELNVEGSRVDRWYRDNRIDFDVQLNDEFYKYSGFDKGHLARREDAEWGTSVAKAKLAADLTCSYANAVPQVPALNRARFGYTGRWGKLEEELLEKGIEDETGLSARICVFNGPLFDEEDPIFKGVAVALKFYKIVVWYNAEQQLQTTCYRLSQEKLVGEIEFEALRFDEVFKTSQIPIGEIERITGLEFHENIVKHDTSNGGEEPLD
ncbi:MAG: DNA/RNA non-specific endonuclease [Pirellulales bacterium]|nr:DNA/RNA non-specific endonuclease [Pirellulales bacterium]